nr:L_ocin_972_ABC: putative bacteriocin export ABC transporter, lactococcin 972 [uncultured bacterium]
MRYLALAADYDGTLAHHGVVAPEVVAALSRLAASGRKLILVTGRELDELLGIFPDITVFDRVVAENGALLYCPKTRQRKPIADAPPASFVEELTRRGVQPLSCGNCIVATVQPNETIVLAAIRDLGLELQVIFNKGAVMVLPPGVNKASGLVAAAAELGLSTHNVVAVGDGENDHALLETAEYSAAVANAIPMLREKADRVTAGSHGDGVMELIADLLENDLAASPPRTARRTVLLGADANGAEITIPPAGMSVLVAGSSGAGKSTLATGLLERLQAQGYQYCIVDPEGDYADLTDAVVLGNAQRAPGNDEILTALEKPDVNVGINLIGLPLEARPDFFLGLLPRLQELRVKTGRPHWILVDETHHLLPADHQAPPTVLTHDLAGMIYVTVHPDSVAPAVLKTVNLVAALGAAPASAIEKFCAGAGLPVPSLPSIELEPGQAVVPSSASRGRRWSGRAGARSRLSCSISRRARASAAATGANTRRASCRPSAVSSFAAPTRNSICARRTWSSSIRSRTGSTTAPGCTTCTGAIIPNGCARASRTIRSPIRWRQSSGSPH